MTDAERGAERAPQGEQPEAPFALPVRVEAPPFDSSGKTWVVGADGDHIAITYRRDFADFIARRINGSDRRGE